MDRPAIVGIDSREEPDRTEVTIVLGYRDEEYRGEASGPPGPEAFPRIVGEATLRAVEQVAGGGVRLDLEAVATASLGEVQVAMAQVRLDGDEHRFIGSALIEGHDSAAATVKAVLDAINRQLERILRPAP